MQCLRESHFPTNMNQSLLLDQHRRRLLSFEMIIRVRGDVPLVGRVGLFISHIISLLNHASIFLPKLLMRLWTLFSFRLDRVLWTEFRVLDDLHLVDLDGLYISHFSFLLNHASILLVKPLMRLWTSILYRPDRVLWTD